MLRYRTRAQVAFEFVILVSIAFAALLVFTAFVREYFTSVEDETGYYKLKDVALLVKSELALATTLNDGYSRSFTIPETIEHLDYDIAKEDDFIVLNSSDAEYYVRVPGFSGNLVKGVNVIIKQDGLIEVNP